MPSNQKKIALWGNFGAQNFGNECTLASSIHQFRRILPDCELEIVCRFPQDAAARHGILATAMCARDRWDGGIRLLRQAKRLYCEAIHWTSLIASLSRCDALVIAGTGILADDGEGAFGLPFELAKWVTAAKLSRCPVYFLSVGVEPLDHRWARLFVRRALNAASYRSFRDEHSRNRLAKGGVWIGSAEIVPDMAFGLPHYFAPVGDQIDEPIKVAVGVFNFKNCGLAGGEDLVQYQNYLELLAGFVRWLLEHGYDIRILIGDGAYDAPVCKDLRSRLAMVLGSLDASRYVDDVAKSYQAVVEQIESVDYVVATRFHNVLLALLQGKPTISLAYEGKNDALMASFGLQRYCQSLVSLDLGRLITQFQLLCDEPPAQRHAICDTVRRFAGLVEQQFELVARSIRKKSVG